MRSDPPEQLRRLRELVSAFYQLGSSLELPVVLQNTLEAATRLMAAEAGSIALIDRAGTHLEFVESTDRDADALMRIKVPLGEGIVGHVARERTSVRLADASRDDRFFKRVDQKLGRSTTSYLCVPLIVQDAVIGTAQVMNRVGGEEFSWADQELMEGFARQAALAIHNARLVQFRLRQQAIESELQVCAAIQRQLFPTQPPRLPGFEAYGSSRPCHEVGGDYYTFVDRPDGSTDLVLADVSGKGLPAAMTVSDLHAAIRLISPLDQPLSTTIEQVNSHLVASLMPNQFVTLVALRVSPGSRSVSYTVAGHPPPFVIRPGGECSRLEVSGPILGFCPARYESHSLDLAPDELLLAFSDGYSEAEAPDDTELGELGVARAVEPHARQGLAEIHARLDAHAQSFMASNSQSDDQTLLLLRVIAGDIAPEMRPGADQR